jgi:nucleoside 2-deoxyribosyltransferase
MLTVYIAGPMAGFEDLNFPAFYAAASAWEDAGWEVVNPAELDFDDVINDRRFYLREDIKLLVDCDAIAMLEGYNDSPGAMLELNIAQALKIRVLDAMHPIKYASHPFIERNGCCNLVDYMHEDGWWSKT